MSYENEIFRCFSPDIEALIEKVYTRQIEEVRLRLGLPLSIVMGGESFFVGSRGIAGDINEAYRVTKGDIEYALACITKGSYYSFEDEIKNGFVTVYGGHRVGIGGRGVSDNKKITSLCDISSLNFRFARQIKNCADDIIPFIKNGRQVYNTVIISPPGWGKTTVLREIARKLSYIDIKICVIDERYEICAQSEGQAFYDIGPNTDVYSGIEKKQAIPMAVRCLSPQVIITDELGNGDDIESILYASSCGVNTVASMHGASVGDLVKKSETKKLLSCFDRFVILGQDKRVCEKGVLEEYIC